VGEFTQFHKKREMDILKKTRMTKNLLGVKGAIKMRGSVELQKESKLNKRGNFKWGVRKKISFVLGVERQKIQSNEAKNKRENWDERHTDAKLVI